MFHLHRATQDTTRLWLASLTGLSPALVGLSNPFNSPSACHSVVLQPHKSRNPCGLGYSPFARRYLGNHYLVLFSSAYLDVSVRPVRLPTQSGYPLRDGLPHSDTHGSSLRCSSPWIFAALHVLHRLLVPRHPPCALCNFIYRTGAHTPAPYAIFICVLSHAIAPYLFASINKEKGQAALAGSIE